MLTEGFSSTYSFPELLGGKYVSQQVRRTLKGNDFTRAQGGYGLLTPSHCYLLLFCLFFNVFLISDIVWATSLPPTALYSQKKVQHFHLERDCTRFCDHVIATLSALPCQKTPLQRWNWRSHWSGWQHGSSSCRAQPLQQVESHQSVPEHLGLGYSPHPETLLCSSSVGPDPARQREQTKISYMIDRNRRGKKRSNEWMRGIITVSSQTHRKRQWRNDRTNRKSERGILSQGWHQQDR